MENGIRFAFWALFGIDGLTVIWILEHTLGQVLHPEATFTNGPARTGEAVSLPAIRN